VKKRQEKITKMILNYLRKNRDAGDTLDGITRWWLELEKIEISVDDVVSALESLIQKGLIRRYKTKGGSTFYKINREALS